MAMAISLPTILFMETAIAKVSQWEAEHRLSAVCCA
jgi:hypothetical protein